MFSHDNTVRNEILYIKKPLQAHTKFSRIMVALVDVMVAAMFFMYTIK